MVSFMKYIIKIIIINLFKFSLLRCVCLLKELFFLIQVYVDLGTGASDTAELKFDFTDSTALANNRFFEIKVTQLPCSNEYK